MKYAENPPKRYQDIYNVNFECEDWKGLWTALRDVVLLWVSRGVTVFRVDNPHTKPVAFWEWLIAEVRTAHPDVIFLAEAFTRPAMMTTLGKAGFAQSYTYFTWKNTRWELLELMGQLLDWRDYCRPNVFTNTPGHPPRVPAARRQAGVRGKARARCDAVAVLRHLLRLRELRERAGARRDREEYLDSEKYELKQRALDGPLLPLVAALNRIRRENAALQRLETSPSSRRRTRRCSPMRSERMGTPSSWWSTSTRKRRARASASCRPRRACRRRITCAT